MDKISSNRIVKIGIVTDNAEETARKLTGLLHTVPAYDHAQPEVDIARYTDIDRYCRYNGEVLDHIQLDVRLVYVEPVYFEIIEPKGEQKNPWHDHLKQYGTSVCFISFYINGFQQHIDMMNKKGFPLLFEEEKGFERYAYFDTMADLGFLLEMKERIPNTPKAEE